MAFNMDFILFSVAIFVLLMFVLIFVVRNNVRVMVLEPIVFFVLIYLVSYFFVPAYAYFFNYSRYDLDYPVYSYFYASLYSLLFICSLIFFYLLIGGRLGVVSHVGLKRLDMKSFFLLGGGFVVICSAALLEFLKMISSYGLSVFLANRIVLTSGLGYYKLLLFLPVMWVIVYSIERYFVKGGGFSWVKYARGVLMVLLASLPLLVLGSRSNILIGVIIFSFSVLLFSLKSGDPKLFGRLFNKFLILVLGLVVFGGFLGGVRQGLMSTEYHYASKGSQIPLESVTAAFSSYENLAWFFTNPDRVKYQLGGTYLSVSLGPVPRAVWPEKPTGGGPTLKNLIAPGSYDLVKGDKISSYTTGAPSEAYLNFGWYGVIFGSVIFAAILIFVRTIIMRSSTALGIVVGVALLLRASGFVNAEFYGVCIQFFLIGSFYFMCRFCYRRRAS